jgi:uncharacterized membrane protein
MTTRLTVSSPEQPIKISVNTTFSAPNANNVAGPFYIELGLTSKNVTATVNLRSIGDVAAAKTTLIVPGASTDYTFNTVNGLVGISTIATATKKPVMIAILDITKALDTPLVKFTDLTAKFRPVSTAAHILTANELLTAASPTYVLNDTGASATDGITNDGLLNAVSAGNTVSYSVDGGKTYVAGSTIPAGTYEIGGIKLIATSANGSVSKVTTNTSKIVIDKTAPISPVIKLDSDTGISATDMVTQDGSITVSGIETGAKVSYSLDAGKTFTAITGTSFVVPEALYTAGQIVVKQTDVAGNDSATATLGALTVDTTVAVPSIALAVDTGSSATDGITNNKIVNVTGLEDGATWQYSVNALPFENGTGTTFNLPADLVYDGGANPDILVRQTDIAGNESDEGSNTDTWTLDTVAPSQLVDVELNDTGIDGDYITSLAKVTVNDLEAKAMLHYNVDGSDKFIAATGNSFVMPNGSYAAGNIQWKQTDLAGNTSVVAASGMKIVANDIVNVTAGNTDAFDAGKANNHFVVTAGTYTYNIANFGTDDRIDFPVGVKPTVINQSITDGMVDLQYANNGKITVLHLTNLTPAQDGVIDSVYSFNSVFVANAANSLTSTGNSSTETNKVVSAAGVASASDGNIVFDFAKGAYNYTVTGFSTGDRLNFPADVTPTVVNSDVADKKVDLQWASGGQVISVSLTGLTDAQDSNVYSVSSFNTIFGENSLTNMGEIPVVPNGNTLAVSSAAKVDASATHVKFDFAAGNYHYTIAGFGKGDVLNFPDDATATVTNNSAIDDVIEVKWASNGNLITVMLTGVGIDNAADVNSFNNAFGVGSII